MAGQPPLQMPQGLPAQPPLIQPQLEIPQLMAPPGGAAPLPIGGTTRRPSTFLEFYQEPLSDPCQGRYANILNRFNPESAHAVAANVLLEQVVGTPPPRASSLFVLRFVPPGAARLLYAHAV